MSRFVARRVSVGTAAVAIGTAAPGITHELTIANHGSGEIALGNSDLTWSNGFRVGKLGTTIKLTITDGDILFAVIGSGTQDLDIFDFTSDL